MLTRHIASLAILLSVISAPPGTAQANQKALTNADVIKMLNSGLPEATVTAAVQANETNFDVSADALIELQRAGVPQNVVNAMLDAAAKQRGQRETSQSANFPFLGANSAAGQPSTILLRDGTRENVPGEKTQLAQTKTKASSLGNLASDSALNSAFRAGINVASVEAWDHGGSMLGYSAVQGAGSVVSALMARRKPMVTYVWALPGPGSETILQSHTPTFEVNFAGLAGVVADDYEPAIVRLTRTENNWRLVGATQGNSEAMTGTASDWQLYSSFVEDRVPVQTKKIASGQVQVAPTQALAAGDYGIVLRPFSKAAKFSGSDVARNQGAGLLFNSVWSFAVK